MKVSWKQAAIREKNKKAMWTLEGVGFPVSVVEYADGKFEMSCEGFSSIGGIVGLKAAQALAGSYAKQRVVARSQEVLDAISALIGV